TVMPRHDGRHYFIDDGRSVLPSATDEVSTLAIDKAVQNPGQVVEISDLASFIAGGWQDVLNFKQLPLVVKFTGELQDLNTQLVITSIIFSKSEIKAQIGVLTKMPETPTLSSSSGEANRLYFGASFILRKGGSLDGSLILIAPREINLMSLNGIGKLALTTGTGVCLGCSASKNKNPNAFKLNLEGEFVFDPSFIVAENTEGNALTGDNRVAKALFSTTVTGWSSFRFNLVLPSSYGLQVASFPYLGFWSSVNHTVSPVTTDLCTPPQSVSGNITIDFSETGTPIGNGSNAKGVIFQDFKIRLPKQLKKKGDIAAPYVNLTYLYFDEEGDLSALASSNTKFGAGIGDGFSLEINNTLVKIDSGALVEFSVAGDLETPIMQGKEMTFLLANKKEISGDTRLNFTTGMKSGKNEANLNLFGLAKITPQPSSSGNNKKFVEASGGINLTTGNLESFGLGFYHGQFTITKSLTHLTFLYDEIVLSSQYPYLTSFTLTPDSSKAPTIAGFSLTLSSLSIKAETSGDISGYVNITGGLEFGSASNQSITASAGLAFKASTITQEGKHKFKLDKFSLDKIGVAANFPTFGFDAFLNIFDNESRLGVNNLTGFEGKGRFWFSFLSKTDGAKMQGTQDTTKASSGKAGAGVYLLFAKNATGKVAWAIDLDLNFGETGIPLGTVNMKGIYGGAYSNLKIKGDPIAKVSNKGSRTGLSYQWEDGTWGFNLGLDLTAAGNIDVSAMLAVQGRLGKGLQYIKAAGYARFQLNTVTDKVPNVGSKMGSSYAQIADKTDKVSENTALISKDDLKRAQSDEKNAKGTDNGSKSLSGLFGSPSGSENKLAAGIIIAYNFGDEQTKASLSVKMYPDIYINFSTGLSNTTLETTGYGMLYLSSSTKYLHLGKATSINDRLGLKLSATSSALKVKAFVNAYFMLGDELATSVPDPIVPDDFSALFAEQKDDLGNINKINASDDALKSGSGIAFGVAVGINIDMNFLGVVAVNANAGGGFDALIKKIECKEGWVSASSGLGWNAEAQLYGYASATASVLGIEVLSAGIGFLIKAKFPQPFYAEGTFVAYVKVWKAKASIRVHAKVGDPSDCLPDTSMPNIVYNWNFVQSIAPSGSVSPVGNFQVTCVYPKDQIKTSDGTKYLQALEVVYLKQGETIAGNWTYNTVNNPTKYQKVGINPIPSVNSGLVVPLLRKELAKNAKYTAKVRIYIYDLNNNNQIVEVEDKDGIKTRLEQYYSYDFETNDQDWSLTEFDVLAYPAKNQYNTYLKDYNGNGYFNVESTLSNAIAQKCSGCIFELGLYENNTPIKSYPLASIATDKDFSLSDLKKDKIYQIKVTYSKEGKTQSLYDTHYFRTSTFDTWSEKLDAYKKNMNPSWSNEDFGFDISMDESIDETFSADEKKVMNGEALFNTPENWFYYIKNGAGKQNYGTMPPSGYGGTTGNNTKSDGSGSITGIKIVEYPPVSPLNLGFQQAKYPLLNNDEIDNEVNSQTNIKGPIFQIKNFENFITTYRNTNIAYNYIANPASELWLPRGTYSNSKLCFKWLFPINKLDYYQNRVWGQLPSIYDNTNSSNICFSTPQNINFNDFLIFQRRIKVYCKRQLRDSQGILFAFDLQSKNGTSIPFP
ncbi:hypothetical protein GVN22_25770, partial [Cellulophaga sp. BC115SP]|nr:hypothetical protein [Cellulophaga sp. BC115SP]